MKRERTTFNPVDFTVDGICSHCGNCCSYLIPVSEQELKVMKETADRIQFRPSLPEGENVIHLHCPFLYKTAAEKQECAVYENRPAICRHFLCSQSPEELIKQYFLQNGETEPPSVKNVWSIYDRTGLKEGGREIPFTNGPSVKITASDGRRFHLQVGHPVRIELESGRIIPPSLILNVYEDGIQIFDAEREKISIIRYNHIRDMEGDDIILPPLPGKHHSSATTREKHPARNRAERRKTQKSQKEAQK